MLKAGESSPRGPAPKFFQSAEHGMEIVGSGRWRCFFKRGLVFLLSPQEVFSMYSVVLMMALGSGAEAPAWGGRGCHGDGGCHGGYVSCHGGRGCLGGGGCHGCHGGLLARLRHRCD